MTTERGDIHHLRLCAGRYDLDGDTLSVVVDAPLCALLHLGIPPGTVVPLSAVVPVWPLAAVDLVHVHDEATPLCGWQLESPDGEPVWVVMKQAQEHAQGAGQGSVQVTGLAHGRGEDEGCGCCHLQLEIMRSPGHLPRRGAHASLLRGLSHDFGNALASIMGFAEIARTRPVDDPLLSRSLENILKGCAQALSLMDRARAMAGRQSPALQACDLEALVQTWCDEVMPVNASAAPGTIRYGDGGAGTTDEGAISPDMGLGGMVGPASRMDMSSEVAKPAIPEDIRSDPALLRRAFDEIVRNGVTAAGRVHVRLVADGAMARRHPGWCGIAISDGGKGLSPDDFFRFGDPYRHAGGVREGRGNGVALARGIMRALGGVLEVATVPGRGTEVYLLLPSTAGNDWLTPDLGHVGEVAWPEC